MIPSKVCEVCMYDSDTIMLIDERGKQEFVPFSESSWCSYIKRATLNCRMKEKNFKDTADRMCKLLKTLRR